jgi:nucleoprotein TPR
MYRVLLSQSSEMEIPPSMLANPSILLSDAESINLTPKKDDKMKPMKPAPSPDKSVSAMKEEYELYKKETTENIKLLNDQLEDIKVKFTEATNNCIKLTDQLDFAKERQEMLQKNDEHLKKELESMRARNNQLHALVQRNEVAMQKQVANNNISQEQVIKTQGEIERCKSQMEIVKRSEERLLQDNESLRREQRSQTSVFGNLQRMMQNMEKQAFEVRSQLHSRVEAQEQELKTLRKTVSETIEQKQTSVQSMEKQLFANKQLYEAEQKRSEKLTQDLSATKKDLDVMERQKSEAEKKLTSVESRLSSLSSTSSSQAVETDITNETSDHRIKRLERELKEKTNEIDSMELALERTKRNLNHYQEATAAAEENLKQANSSNKDLQDSLHGFPARAFERKQQ